MLILLSAHSEGLQHIPGAWRRKINAATYNPLDGLAALSRFLGKGEASHGGVQTVFDT